MNDCARPPDPGVVITGAEDKIVPLEHNWHLLQTGSVTYPELTVIYS